MICIAVAVPRSSVRLAAGVFDVLIVVVTGCELHTVVPPVDVRSRVTCDRIPRVTIVTGQMDGVLIRLAVNQERVVLGRVPEIVGLGEQFDSKSVGGGRCQLIDLLQSEPVVARWGSKSVPIVGPTSDEIQTVVDYIVDHDPALDGVHWGWNGDVHQTVLGHESCIKHS